ncbi:MAG: nucleotidyltransferase domain-containing protein [Candidatus Omnitrophica bacterium]|nr:nucleotidyltransferase domain-containing protein [Candidatus Omnitrophota bacterium]
MTPREDEISSKVVEILLKRLSPERVILFGSRGKGENNPRSDFDFAVFCPAPGISKEREVKEEIDKISGLYKVDIVYIKRVEEEFKEIIISTGKVIYERK